MKKLTREYLASVLEVDRNLGRVLDQLDQLDQLQIANHTVVIFTSDHGYNIGHHELHHLAEDPQASQTPLQQNKSEPN